MTKSEIFKAAHQAARTMIGHYAARLSLALKAVYKGIKKMSETVTLTGKTYGIRDLLKNKGGKYNAATKSWVVPAEAWDKIKSLDYGRHVRGVVVQATTSKAQAYDNLFNEGYSDSYNPFRGNY